MSWTWRLEDPAGAAIEPASLGVDVPQSDNQGDAESWLGENWRELLARGVATVTLFDGETEGYGPMGLAATGCEGWERRFPPLPAFARPSDALGLGRVALHDVAEDLVDPLQDVVVELHAGGLHVVVHLLGSGGADDRRGDVRVLQHPGDRQLRHRQAE